MKIVVWHAKHGDQYYDASTPEAFAQSCVKILGEMDEMGCYYLEDIDPGDGVDPETLPEPYRAQAVQKEQRRQRANAEAERHNQLITKIKEVIATSDVTLVSYYRERNGERVLSRVEPRAWEYLQRRSDYEYEGVSLESVWVAPAPDHDESPSN